MICEIFKPPYVIKVILTWLELKFVRKSVIVIDFALFFNMDKQLPAW